MNGYNFTERVRKVLAMAREEAERLDHEYVGTEHILLAVIHEGEGLAATVIQNLDADLVAIELAIDGIVKRGEPGKRRGPDLPYTSRAKKVLELAMSQARVLDHNYVGTEHLLLGLIDEHKGIASQVLADFGVTLERARVEIVRLIGTEIPHADGLQLSASMEQTVRRRPGGDPTRAYDAQLPERVRIVMNAGQDVAAESGSAEFLPIHLAIALVQHGEGLANAVLDRLGCDRPTLLRALDDVARQNSPPASPEQVVNVGPEMRALKTQMASEATRRSMALSTLHILLALLDTRPEVATLFDAQDLTANRVRTEAWRIVG